MPDPSEPTAHAADIIIVDDNPVNLKTLMTVLEDHNFKVRVASNADRALQVAQAKPPDLLVLDVMMPETDGLTLCRQFKALDTFAHIPIIFISALTEQADIIRGFEAGGVDYITKPFNASEVIHRVQTHIDLRRLQQQLEVQNCQLIQEVTAREQAEQQLQAANHNLEAQVAERTAELNALFAAMADMVLVYDGLGNCLAVASEPWDVWHIEIAGDVGIALTQTLSMEQRQQQQAVIQMVLAAQTVETFDYCLKLESGDRWFTANLSPLGTNRVLFVARDITTTQRQAQELAATQTQALEATRLKNEFLANMSHELRTPLNGILGACELIGQDLTPDQRPYLKIIQTGGQTLLTLLTDILELSQLEAGHITPHAEPLLLHQQCHKIAQLCQLTANQKGLAFNLKISEDVPEYVFVDGPRLRHILFNLLGNAVKFTAKGSVTLTVSSQDSTDQTIQLYFAVRDTGIGIAPENQQKIFEKFVQLDGSYSRKYEGTGLGLAIAQRFTHLLGGTIDVQSVVGQGTVFTVQFPQVKVHRSTLA